MSTYVYPLGVTAPVTIAAGADFATETTLASILTDQKPEYSSAFVPVIRDFASTALVINVWSEYIASTSAKATLIQYVNESGYPIELGFGAGGAEVSKIIMAQSGEVSLLIPAGTRLSLRCTSAVSSGNFWISALV